MTPERSYFSRFNTTLHQGLAIARGQYDPLVRRSIDQFAQLNHDCPKIVQNPPAEIIEACLADTLTTHNVNLSDQWYWTHSPWSHKELDPLDMMGTMVSFHDLTSRYYPHVNQPHYLYPPQEVMIDFTQAILNAPHPLNLIEQYQIALPLAQYHPTSAGLLAMLGSRLFARNSDTEPYFAVSEQLMLQFYQKIAGFNDLSGNEASEDAGDNYYFWTNLTWGMLMATLERHRQRVDYRAYNYLFGRGVPLMTAARANIAKQPNATTHIVPARLGLAIGQKLPRAYLD